MKSYLVPSHKYKPDLYILHSGTNDLSSKQSPQDIAENLFKLAMNLKDNENNVIISGLIFRNDKLNEKAKAVNEILNNLCVKSDIHFNDNSNITKYHLNGSGLHLNYDGTTALARNYLRCIRL